MLIAGAELLLPLLLFTLLLTVLLIAFSTKHNQIHIIAQQLWSSAALVNFGCK